MRHGGSKRDSLGEMTQARRDACKRGTWRGADALRECGMWHDGFWMQKNCPEGQIWRDGWVIWPSTRDLVEVIISLRWCQNTPPTADRPFTAQIPGFHWPFSMLELCQLSGALTPLICFQASNAGAWWKTEGEWSENLPHTGVCYRLLMHRERPHLFISMERP